MEGCTRCDGEGEVVCAKCDGDGMVEADDDFDGAGEGETMETECERCEGSGYVPCPRCADGEYDYDYEEDDE